VIPEMPGRRFIEFTFRAARISQIK